MVDEVVGHWHLLNLQPIILPWGLEGEAESSNPLVTSLVPLETSALPQVMSKSHLISITKETFVTIISGNFKALGALCQKKE